MGHEVRLIPPQYVKAYVKRGKNDAADAEALCEAVTRPSMRFVPIKTSEQQASCMLMTVRERLVHVRSQLSNAIRSYAGEFGIVGAAGRQNVVGLIKRILEDCSLPKLAQELFAIQAREYEEVSRRLTEIDHKLLEWHRSDEVSIAADVHTRMPVLLSDTHWATWTDGTPREARKLCAAWSGELALDRTNERW